MADLSRVLQALGAILQGGGSTITAIDEDRRRRELDERNSAYLESLMGATERNAAMEGWRPVPEGGLQPLPPQGVPGPRGMPMGVQQPQDNRIVAGGMFRDPSRPSPNQQIELQETLRAAEELRAGMLADLQILPEFQNLDPGVQDGVEALVATGRFTRDEIMRRVAGLSEAQAEELVQRENFASGQNLARKYGLDWDAEYIPGQDYTARVNGLRGTEAGSRISRAINPPGSSGGGAAKPKLTVGTINGTIVESLRNTRDVDLTIEELAPEFPTLTRAELAERVRTVWRTRQDEIIDMGSTSPNRSFSVSGTPDGGGSRAARLAGGQ